MLNEMNLSYHSIDTITQVTQQNRMNCRKYVFHHTHTHTHLIVIFYSNDNAMIQHIFYLPSTGVYFVHSVHFKRF